ncbi:ECF transporter S component [Peptacetobacter hominis]|uniref:ECF transporter S component n=1 Tax=Peptacetobacter hominis TaxID=2743610 RepID=A0A544QXC0_9FIRM|nr:ECF transporter S component [Peptacetobacter hominis]
MKKGLKYDFTLLGILLIPVGVSLNVVGYQLSTVLKLPIFVDQIGTVLVAMLAGPWVGMLTGFLANVVNGMLNPVAIVYSLVAILNGLIIGYASRFKLLTNIIGTIITCAVMNVVGSVVGGLITVFVFGGATGVGTDILAAGLVAAGQALFASVLTVNLITGTFGVMVNVGISWTIVRKLPDRFLVKLNYGMPYVKRK